MTTRHIFALFGSLALLVVPATVATPGGAPTIEWQDKDLWIPHHYLGLAGWSVTACDDDADLQGLYVDAPGYLEGGYSALPEGTSCHALESKLLTDKTDARRGNTFAVEVTAWDAEGRRTVTNGAVRFGILPLDPATVAGMPDLASLPAPQSWPAQFEFRVAPDGTVARAKLTWDGTTHIDTVTGGAADPTLKSVRLTLDLSHGTRSRLMVGSEVMEENFYEQTGPQWWQVDRVTRVVPDTAVLVGELKETVLGDYP